MIPLSDIILENVYSQDDASYLLGDGFSKVAAKQQICNACKSGTLKACKFARRWCFTGAAFLEWTKKWLGDLAIENSDVDNTQLANEPDAERRSE